MRSQMLATIVLLLFAFQSSGTTSPPRSPMPDDLSSKLSKRVTNYNLGAFNLVGALIRVSTDFQIPMGIAWVNSPVERAELPFAWKEATVAQIIEDIAKTQPGYQVQIKNGVVHILPLQGVILDHENFLKLKIRSFEVHDAYVEVASFKLHMLVTPRRYGQISIGATGDSKVHIELNDRPVEDVLDALVTASLRKIWIVTFANDSSLTPKGLRRAMSLWSGSVTPDEEQPSWDLLRWGDSLPPLVSAAK